MLLDVISQATCQDSTSLHPGPLSFVDVITGRAEIRWICGKMRFDRFVDSRKCHEGEKDTHLLN